jgi:hypothetical protein
MNMASAAIHAALVGLGATIVLDLWAALLLRVGHIAAPSWPMVGRWIGNMARGRFAHASMAEAEPVRGEAAIGWTAHYLIGAGYGLLVLAVCGRAWLIDPTVLPALEVSWVLLAAPFFIMMPGMGSGLAGANTPRPGVTRLKSFTSHTVFGLGMYGTALALSSLWAARVAGV